MQLDADQYIEFERLNAGVIQPHAGQINPYNLGYALLREVVRIHDEPTDRDREQFATVGQVSGWERLLEVVEAYDDAALVAEFLTPRVCEACRLFAWEREPGEPARVTSLEAEEVRAAWLDQHVNQGFPRLAIVDADGFRRGALMLEHLDQGVGLDIEYAEGTLPFLARMWGRRTVLKSVGRDPQDDAVLRDVWFDCDPAAGEVALLTERPAA